MKDVVVKSKSEISSEKDFVITMGSIAAGLILTGAMMIIFKSHTTVADEGLWITMLGAFLTYKDIKYLLRRPYLYKG